MNESSKNQTDRQEAFLKTTSPSFPTSSSHSLVIRHIKPAFYGSRRRALGMTDTQAGELLGISSASIGAIESAPISEEVDFLYNLALSTLELARVTENEDEPEPIASNG